MTKGFNLIAGECLYYYPEHLRVFENLCSADFCAHEVHMGDSGIGSIIIAGGGLGSQFGDSFRGVSNRALIPIHGAPIVSYIIRALRECPMIQKIALIAPQKFSEYPFSRVVDHLVPEGKNETENILKGIDVLEDSERILMVTSDLPLLTGEIIAEFLEICPPDAHICYSVVRKEDIDRKFPDRKWVFVKIKEGRFTGSSIFLFNRNIIRERGDNLKKVMDARRDVFKLASLWGWNIPGKLLLGILTIEAVEKKMSTILKCNCKGVISTSPEIAMDVDKPSDIDLVEKLVRPIT